MHYLLCLIRHSKWNQSLLIDASTCKCEEIVVDFCLGFPFDTLKGKVWMINSVLFSFATVYTIVRQDINLFDMPHTLQLFQVEGLMLCLELSRTLMAMIIHYFHIVAGTQSSLHDGDVWQYSDKVLSMPPSRGGYAPRRLQTYLFVRERHRVE